MFATRRICIQVSSHAKNTKNTRNFNTTPKNDFKVAVAGASGGIGQPLSLLLKQSPLVTDLRLYDIAHTIGVAADLSHIETPAKVKGFQGEEAMDEAFCECDVIVVPAGVPRKPGMSRDDLFKMNAGIVQTIACGAARAAPKALICIISNPVNAMVPIVAEVYKQQCVFDPARIFGVTTLDVVRANTFVAELLCVSPAEVNVPVIGGHAGATIIPVLSQMKPKGSKLDQATMDKLIPRIQEAGTEVVKAKDGAGSATLSMAFAAMRFVNALLRGLSGEENVIECAYVASDCVPGAPFFSTPLRLGCEGIEENLGVGELSEAEEKLVAAAVPALKKSADKGIQFIKGDDDDECEE